MYIMSMKKKRILRSLCAILCTVTIASVSPSVYAAPSKKDLENKTSDLQGELNSLNSELASLVKELENTSSKIETLAAEVEKAKLDLAAAQLNEEVQYDSMKDRIKFMYEGGSTSLLQILFSSESMADFLNKAEYVSTISDYDRDMLDELIEARENVETKQKNLETQQAELTDLKTELTSREKALNSKISSTSGQLADYSAQLERAKAAEAALAQAQNNASSSGSNSSSGGSGNSNNSENSGGSSNNGTNTPADTSDLVLFAALLQCEAGGSGYDGMLAVATVVMNRVASPRYPNSIRGVIYQSGQFSPTWNGSLNRVLAKGPSSTAYSVAQAAMGGARHSAVINCYSFRAAWTGVAGVNVGGNIFF